jgi:hypothetical protein
MNHQPFKSWLLSEEDLSAEEARSLQKHLAECEICSQLKLSLKDVERTLRSSPQVAPNPGFTHRWQVHLVDYEKRKQTRQGWVSIGITAFVALVLVLIMAYQIWGLVQDPGPYMAVAFEQLVRLISDYFILQRLFTTSTWLKPVNILVTGFLVVGMISFMSVLWMSAYQKINIMRRIE